MQAVIKISGQQHLVTKGDEIVVDRMDSKAKTVTFEPLLVFDDKSTYVGKPTVEGAKVSATIKEDIKGDKVRIMRFKAKKRVKVKTGHRQPQTVLTIKNIEVASSK